MRNLRAIGILAVVLAAPPLRGAEKEAIDRAVERGIKSLLALQKTDGSWPDSPGMTSLAGVTLLECDIPPGDPAIQRAAEFVRKDVLTTNQVYTICTAIFFLDRLGEPVDIPLIEALTVRLLYGQMETGAWAYMCSFGAVSGDEVKRLEAHYQKPRQKNPPATTGTRSVTDLAPEIQQRLRQVRLQTGENGGPGDHSNTQFASLALWVGRRQGVPVDRALALLDAHYRTTQNADGGWGYRLSSVGLGAADTTPGMTCAGVLGLSVAQGMVLATGRTAGPNVRQAFDPAHDVALRKALARVSLNVGGPIQKLGGKDIYFLWSLERILVAMDIERLGGKDWYKWGSELLLANQQANGSWPGEHSSYGADTCFALLFLRKANLAGDLTNLLKKDFVLKAGGPIDKDPKKPPVDPKDPKKPPVDPKDPMKPPIDMGPAKAPAETRPTFTQPQSARLAESLVKATSAGQVDLFDKLRQGKGVEYTEALAGAIPQLSGDGKRKAREVLAERLTRMKADTLSHYLQDDDVEIRRAAALASGTREFKDQVPQLIELLGDPDQGVVLAAHTALKAMTGQKIGPAAEPWRSWWKAKK